MTDSNPDSPRRKLKIDLSELELAFDNSSWEAEYYLDRETGDIILIGSMITDITGITQQIEDVSNRERYLQVPHADSREEHSNMERFAASVQDTALRQRLDVALKGKGAFRRFKDALLDYPSERERWFRFQADRVQQRILDWLDSEDIEPISEI
jgi:hypothetical protein